MKRALLPHRVDLPPTPPAAALERIVAAFALLDFRQVAAERIEAILHENPIADAALAPYLHFVAGRYTRIRLHAQADFELLALCWPAQTRSPIHAHGNARGFMQVQRGTLVSDEYALVAGGKAAGAAALRHVGEQTLRPGDFDVRTQTQDIHRFTTLDEPAVTLHVYAKPLARCLVFDPERENCRLVESSYDRLPA